MRTLIARFRVGFPFGITAGNDQRTKLGGTRPRYLPVLTCLCSPSWQMRQLAASWLAALWPLETRMTSPATVPASARLPRSMRGR